MKDLADDKNYVTQKLNFVLDEEDIIVEKRENAGYHHFLLFPQCFQKLSFTGLIEVVIVW